MNCRLLLRIWRKPKQAIGLEDETIELTPNRKMHYFNVTYCGFRIPTHASSLSSQWSQMHMLHAYVSFKAELLLIAYPTVG